MPNKPPAGAPGFAPPKSGAAGVPAGVVETWPKRLVVFVLAGVDVVPPRPKEVVVGVAAEVFELLPRPEKGLPVLKLLPPKSEVVAGAAVLAGAWEEVGVPFPKPENAMMSVLLQVTQLNTAICCADFSHV